MDAAEAARLREALQRDVREAEIGRRPYVPPGVAAKEKAKPGSHARDAYEAAEMRDALFTAAGHEARPRVPAEEPDGGHDRVGHDAARRVAAAMGSVNDDAGSSGRIAGAVAALDGSGAPAPLGPIGGFGAAVGRRAAGGQGTFDEGRGVGAEHFANDAGIGVDPEANRIGAVDANARVAGRAPPAAFMLTREQVVDLAKKRGYPVQFMSDAEIFRVMQPELTSMRAEHLRREHQQQRLAEQEERAQHSERSLPVGMPPAPHGSPNVYSDHLDATPRMGSAGQLPERRSDAGTPSGRQLSHDDRALLVRSARSISDAGRHGIGLPPREPSQALSVGDVLKPSDFTTNANAKAFEFPGSGGTGDVDGAAREAAAAASSATMALARSGQFSERVDRTDRTRRTTHDAAGAVVDFNSGIVPVVNTTEAEALGAEKLLETFHQLHGEQLFGAVRSIRILAGRSFAAKTTLRRAMHGITQYMNETTVAAGRIEAAFCIHNLVVGHAGCQREAAAVGALRPLTRFLWRDDIPTALQAAQAIRHIAELPAALDAIVASGAIPPLVKLLENSGKGAAAGIAIAEARKNPSGTTDPTGQMSLGEMYDAAQCAAAAALRNICAAERRQDPAWLAGIYWQGRRPGYTILEQGAVKHLVALCRDAVTEAGRGAAAGALGNLMALAGSAAREAAMREGCVPLLLELTCFAEDAVADAAAAAMWQLTSATDAECVGNPMAHERGGCYDKDMVTGGYVKADALSPASGDDGGPGPVPEKVARGARWWNPPLQPCVRLLKRTKETRDDDRAACLHAIAAFCVPTQTWLRAADVKVGEGSKADWWAVSTPERPDGEAQRKVMQAGGLDVITAHVVDASAPPTIRGEAARALWCLVAKNRVIAAEALRGGAGLAHCVVQMLTTAPPAAKAAAAGIVGAASKLDDTLAHHFVATGCVQPLCLLLACGDVQGKCAAAEAVCTLSDRYPGELAAGGATPPLAQMFSQGLGRAAPPRAKVAVTFALANLVRHDPSAALFLIRSGAAGPVAQFLADADDAVKGAAAALCRAMASCRDAADTVARSSTAALVLLAGAPSVTAATRREAFLAMGAVGDSSKEAAMGLIAKGALGLVRANLAAGYSGEADGSPAVANAIAALPAPGGAGRLIWGGSAKTAPGRAAGEPGGGFKGTGLGTAVKSEPGSRGDVSTYTQEECRAIARAALVALAGLASGLDFSQVDHHGPLTPLLLRCVEVDAAVPVVESAARTVQALLTLGRGNDPRVALFKTGRTGGEEVSDRQMLLQPLLSGLSRALAAPRDPREEHAVGLAPSAASDAAREDQERLTAMRAAILGAMAAMCERCPTNCLLLGAIPGSVAEIARLAEKADAPRLRVLAAELLCEMARGGGLRLATQSVDLGAARAAVQLLEDAQDDRTAVAACRLMEALAEGDDNTITVACAKPRALLPLLPLLGPQATLDAREAAASLVAQLAASTSVHFLLSRAGLIPPLLQLVGPGNPAVAQGNAMVAVARLAGSALAGHPEDLAASNPAETEPDVVRQNPMELPVAEYRSQIERQRELKLGMSVAQQHQHETEDGWDGTSGGGLVLVGDSGEAKMTRETAERRRAAVHADLLQGGACRVIAAAVAPETGATPVTLHAAAQAAASLALIADYANDQVLLDAVAPLEEAAARVEGPLGGSVVSMQDVLDAAANPAYRRLLPGESEDHAFAFREAIRELKAFGRKVEFAMRHRAMLHQ